MNHLSRRLGFLCSALVWIVIGTGCQRAHTPADRQRPGVAASEAVALPPSKLDRANSCVIAARACAEHVLANTFDGVVNCMPDDVVERLGGHQALVEIAKSSFADMTRRGVYMDKTTIEPPSEMTKQGTRTFAVLTQEITLRVPNGHLRQRAFLVAISADDGQTWRFIDGAGLKNPRTIAKFFPDLPTSISLPKVDPPVFVESAK
jgi:hypothetical protein